jgi:hypothetical protein
MVASFDYTFEILSCVGDLRWLLRAGDHERSGHLEALVGRDLCIPSRFQCRGDIWCRTKTIPLTQRFVEAFNKDNLETSFRMSENCREVVSRCTPTSVGKVKRRKA